MQPRSLHDGRDDGLVPLESLALDKVTSFGELLQAMSKTAFGGRQLGEAFEIVVAMVRDHSCRVVLTISGAMTVAKQGRIVCDMIDRGYVQAVVATGALIAHGLTESIGLVQGDQQVMGAIGGSSPAVETRIELMQFIQVHTSQFGCRCEIQLRVDIDSGEIGLVGDGL